MKKIYILSLLLFFTLKTTAQSSYGTQVGTTYYDIPSQGASPNRIVYNEDDSSVSITWTQSIANVAQPVSYDRGAGYNHFRPAQGWIYGDQGACRVNNGCSGEYSGFPEIINFPEKTFYDYHNNVYPGISKEIIFTHSGGLKQRMRFYRGDSTWRPSKKLLFDQDLCENSYEGFWPRAVTNDKYIHMIAVNIIASLIPEVPDNCLPYSQLYQPLLYYRSADQGETWDIQNFILPGLEDTFLFKSIRFDSYAIATNKNVVAITVGSFDQPWVLWKSVDNGINWETKIIKGWNTEFIDKPNFQNSGKDYKYGPDKSHSLVIDDNGNVHCFVGRLLMELDSNNLYSGINYFESSGIYYWNDKFANFCEPMVIAELIDFTYANGIPHTPIYSNQANWNPWDGMAQKIEETGYEQSATSMSNAAVDANGNIYLVYSSIVEGTSTETGVTSFQDGMPLRDIYLVWSNDNGQTWSKEMSLAALEGADDGSGGTSLEEDIYPMVAHKVGSDHTLHILFNMDYKPGSDIIFENDEFSQQYQTYVGLDVNSLLFTPKASFSPTPINATITYSNTNFQIGDTALVTCNEGYLSFEPYVSFYNGIVDINFKSDSVYILIDSVSKLYNFEVILANACSNTMEETIFNVTNGTLKAIIEKDSIIACMGETIQLFGFGSGAASYNYLWNTGDTVQSITIEAIMDTFYVLSVGGIDDTLFVKVNSIPNANAGGPFEAICPSFDDYTNPDEYFLELGSNSVANNSYRWSPVVGMTYFTSFEATPIIRFTSDTMNYVLKVTNQLGCSAYDTAIVNYIPCGIEELKKEIAVTIFPNPTTGKINVTSEVQFENYTIYNTFGQIIAFSNINKKAFNINLEQMSIGIYILQLSKGMEMVSKKIVME